MPYGYLFSSLLIAGFTLLAAAGRSRPRIVGALSFRGAMLVNEQPFLFLALLVLSTLLAAGQSDLATPVGWIALALAALGGAGQLYLLRNALATRAATEHALDDGLGAEWRTAIDGRVRARLRTRLPWGRIVFAPLAVGRPGVTRVGNLPYGDDDRQQRLDLYRSRSAADAPVLVYFHGGGFRGGSKRREARALLTHLASQGWVCVSANYRLQPYTRRDALIDVKRVIAWVRAHAHEYGADPATVFLAGGSGGGYLSAMAAVTQNDPSLQPGFEDADTSVTAVIALYGYFGDRGDDAPGTAPLTTDATSAPPMFVVHGDHDTLALVAGARLYTEQLRAESAEPVVYAELPGAQHVWDLVHSIRSDTVVNAVEGFAAWVRSRG